MGLASHVAGRDLALSALALDLLNLERKEPGNEWPQQHPLPALIHGLEQMHRSPLLRSTDFLEGILAPAQENCAVRRVWLLQQLVEPLRALAS